jgi:hypothetical protein
MEMRDEQPATIRSLGLPPFKPGDGLEGVSAGSLTNLSQTSKTKYARYEGAERLVSADFLPPGSPRPIMKEWNYPRRWWKSTTYGWE